MEKKFDRIEKYLMNDMPDDEKKEFEQLLKKDAGLYKEYLFRRGVNEAVLEDDIMNLRENLNEIVSNSKNKKLLLPLRKIAVAATIFIFIVLSLFVLFPTRKSADQLFNLYYKAYPALANIRSSENNSESEIILNSAFHAYELGNFTKASKSFSKVLSLDSKNSMAKLYLALCYLENNNLSKSEELLIDLTLNSDHLFWDQANWYLALLYLKQEDNEKARLILKKIIHEDMAHKKEANQILKRLG